MPRSAYSNLSIKCKFDRVSFIPYHLGPQEKTMSVIHEVATITSKGQITLPKPIRQALGVDYGG